MVSSRGRSAGGVAREFRRRVPGLAGQVSRGVAAMELAIVLPLLVTLALGTANYGLVAQATVCINNAASVGAFYATSSSSRSTDRRGIQNVVLRDLQGGSGINPSDLSVTSENSTDSQGYAFVNVTVSVPFKTLFRYPVDVVNISRSCSMRVLPD